MWNILKYIGIVIFSLCSGYFLVCGVVLIFLYQDRMGGLSYLCKALLAIVLYSFCFFDKELCLWTQKRKLKKGERISSTSNT